MTKLIILTIAVGVLLFAAFRTDCNFMIDPNTRDAIVCQKELQTIRTELDTYKMLYGSYPTTQQNLQALVVRPEDFSSTLKWKQFLSKLPVDPWGAPYLYKSPSVQPDLSYDLYSTGPDKKESADDIRISKNS